MTRFKGLVLDHDDTTVKSTEEIHYPALLEILRLYRPGCHFSMTDFLRYSYDPGVYSLFRDTLGFTEQEIESEYSFWQNFAEKTIPHFHDGMEKIIDKQRAEGGFVFAVSHSSSKIILRDYSAHGVPIPDAVYGWELGEEKRKPNIFPLVDIMERFSLSPSELIVVDDLKPGLDMAHRAGVFCAGACWGYDVPEIRDAIEKDADICFRSVKDLYSFLFGDE